MSSTNPDPDIVDVEVVADLTATSRCDQGFVQVRRRVLRNRHADGSTSREYPCDAVERPPGYDAVAVVAFDKVEGGAPRVLLRRCLRPVVHLRPPETAPVAPPMDPGWPGAATDGAGPRFFVWELVAGVLEPGDVGEAGVRRRAIEELHEEAGLTVAPDELLSLGAPIFPSPGVLTEAVYLFAVETPLDARLPEDALPGDGSPMEDCPRVAVVGLGEALARCREGRIRDAKTEVALHRLRQLLA
jgi:ADP-ribose pyrophosphatase